MPLMFNIPLELRFSIGRSLEDHFPLASSPSNNSDKSTTKFSFSHSINSPFGLPANAPFATFTISSELMGQPGYIESIL